VTNLPGADQTGTTHGPGGRPGLRRVVGLDTAAALVIANTVGSGIFTTSGFIARDLGSPWWLLALWIAGGMIEFVGALAYSELAAAMPEAGGEYVYLREAYGPLIAYMSGWTSFFVGFSGAIAAAALAFVGYLHQLAPIPDASALSGKLVAIAVLAVLTTAHVLGVRFGGIVQRLLTVGTVVAIVALVGFGLSSGHGDLGNFASHAPAHGYAAVALIFVLYAYSGWNAAAYIAGEVRDPGRNLPRALILGIGVVIVLYVGMNLMYIYALPIPAMSGVLAIAEKSSMKLFGPTAAALVAALLALAILNSASAMVIAGPRVYYAMARDRVFPSGLGLVNPVFGTPARAMVLQGVWSSVLILFFGAFEKVVLYTGFAVVIFAGLSVASLIVLRIRRPAMARPFRMPGHPWLPAAYVLILSWIAVYTLVGRPAEALVSLAVVGFGIPWYFLSKFFQSPRT
jgi:basic amino acid/polyamine antiporter, APA family